MDCGWASSDDEASMQIDLDAKDNNTTEINPGKPLGDSSQASVTETYNPEDPTDDYDPAEPTEDIKDNKVDEEKKKANNNDENGSDDLDYDPAEPTLSEDELDESKVIEEDSKIISGEVEDGSGDNVTEQEGESDSVSAKKDNDDDKTNNDYGDYDNDGRWDSQLDSSLNITGAIFSSPEYDDSQSSDREKEMGESTKHDDAGHKVVDNKDYNDDDQGVKEIAEEANGDDGEKQRPVDARSPIDRDENSQLSAVSEMNDDNMDEGGYSDVPEVVFDDSDFVLEKEPFVGSEKDKTVEDDDEKDSSDKRKEGRYNDDGEKSVSSPRHRRWEDEMEERGGKDLDEEERELRRKRQEEVAHLNEEALVDLFREESEPDKEMVEGDVVEQQQVKKTKKKVGSKKLKKKGKKLKGQGKKNQQSKSSLGSERGVGGGGDERFVEISRERPSVESREEGELDVEGGLSRRRSHDDHRDSSQHRHDYRGEERGYHDDNEVREPGEIVESEGKKKGMKKKDKKERKKKKSKREVATIEDQGDEDSQKFPSFLAGFFVQDGMDELEEGQEGFVNDFDEDDPRSLFAKASGDSNYRKRQEAGSDRDESARSFERAVEHENENNYRVDESEHWHGTRRHGEERWRDGREIRHESRERRHESREGREVRYEKERERPDISNDRDRERERGRNRGERGRDRGRDRERERERDREREREKEAERERERMRRMGEERRRGRGSRSRSRERRRRSVSRDRNRRSRSRDRSSRRRRHRSRSQDKSAERERDRERERERERSRRRRERSRERESERRMRRVSHSKSRSPRRRSERASSNKENREESNRRRQRQRARSDEDESEERESGRRSYRHQRRRERERERERSSSPTGSSSDSSSSPSLSNRPDNNAARLHHLNFQNYSDDDDGNSSDVILVEPERIVINLDDDEDPPSRVDITHGNAGDDGSATLEDGQSIPPPPDMSTGGSRGSALIRINPEIEEEGDTRTVEAIDDEGASGDATPTRDEASDVESPSKGQRVEAARESSEVVRESDYDPAHPTEEDNDDNNSTSNAQNEQTKISSPVVAAAASADTSTNDDDLSTVSTNAAPLAEKGPVPPDHPPPEEIRPSPPPIPAETESLPPPHQQQIQQQLPQQLGGPPMPGNLMNNPVMRLINPLLLQQQQQQKQLPPLQTQPGGGLLPIPTQQHPQQQQQGARMPWPNLLNKHRDSADGGGASHPPGFNQDQQPRHMRPLLGQQQQQLLDRRGPLPGFGHGQDSLPRLPFGPLGAQQQQQQANANNNMNPMMQHPSRMPPISSMPQLAQLTSLLPALEKAKMAQQQQQQQLGPGGPMFGKHLMQQQQQSLLGKPPPLSTSMASNSMFMNSAHHNNNSNNMPFRSSNRPDYQPESTEVVDMDMSPGENDCELELPSPNSDSSREGRGSRKRSSRGGGSSRSMAQASAAVAGKGVIQPVAYLKALSKALEKLDPKGHSQSGGQNAQDNKGKGGSSLSKKHRKMDLNDDDVPASAVDLTNKEKYMKKLHLQERVIDEVKLAVKPFYSSKKITKDQYKLILRKAVPKVCHCKKGNVNSQKIQQLVEAYVSKLGKKSGGGSAHSGKKKSKGTKDGSHSAKDGPSTGAGVKQNGERAKKTVASR